MTFFSRFINALGWLFVLVVVMAALSVFASVIAHPHLVGLAFLLCFLVRD